MRWFRPALATMLFLIVSSICPAGAQRPIHLSEPESLSAAGGATITAVRGKLNVPASRREAGAGTLELEFVWLKSASPRSAPIVYLAGGPGQAATPMADDEDALASMAPLLEIADIILIDQRGTGRSQPETRWRSPDPAPAYFFESEAEASAFMQRMHRRARHSMLAAGVPIHGLTTEESADDIEDLRVALGLPRLSLFGFSYGTHLGLSVIRRHGAHIERAALMGVEGPDHTLKLPLGMDRSFARIAALAREDPDLGPEFDLEALLARVQARLAANPMIVRIRLPDETVQPMPVSAFGLNLILSFDIGDASDIPVFPRLLHSIDQGDPRLLQWFVQKRIGLAGFVNAMNMMMDSASGATPARLAQILRERRESRFGSAVNWPYPEIASVWNPPPLADDFRTPVRSHIPVLFLSGDLDWNTPPAQAEEVRRGFPNGQAIVVRNAGHEQIVQHPEVMSALYRFFAGQPVGDVAPEFPPIDFIPLEGRASVDRHPSLAAQQDPPAP